MCCMFIVISQLSSTVPINQLPPWLGMWEFCCSNFGNVVSGYFLKLFWNNVGIIKNNENNKILIESFTEYTPVYGEIVTSNNSL